MNFFVSDWISLRTRVRVEWECFWVSLKGRNSRWLNPRWQCLNPRWQNSRWLPSSSWVRINVFESDWISLSQSFGQNGLIQWWQNSRWLPSSSWVRMNEFESDWISLTQTQSGVRVFLSESERRYTRCLNPRWQNVWDGHHHQVESEFNEWRFFLVPIMGTFSENEDFCCGNGGNHLGKCDWVSEKTLRWLNPGWQNWRWQNSRWLPSSTWVRMNEFESDWISSESVSEWSENVFEWIWEKLTRCLNPRWQCLNPKWQNSRWLSSSSSVRINQWIFLRKWWNQWMSEVCFVQMVGREVWVKCSLCKWWEPVLATVSEFERKN